MLWKRALYGAGGEKRILAFVFGLKILGKTTWTPVPCRLDLEFKFADIGIWKA